MQNSVQLLEGILQVLGKIEQNTSKAGGGKPAGDRSDTFGGDTGGSKIFGGLGFNMGEFFQGLKGFKGGQSFLKFTKKFAEIAKDISDKDAQKMKIISESFDSISSALPGLVKGLSAFGKPRMMLGTRIAISNLKLLYEFMDEAGDARKARKVKRAADTFREISDSLKEVAKPVKQISRAFLMLGLGIVAFAGSILLAGSMLGLGGVNVIWGILGAIGGIAIMFGVLALAKKFVGEGVETLQKMGLGMAALALGIVSCSIAIAVVPAILGASGNAMAGVLMVSGILVGMSILFAGIGLLAGLISQGVAVATSMGLGMMALAGGVLVMALVARLLGGLGDKEATNKKGETRGKFGQIMAGIGPGLGVMGIVLVGAALFFAGVGLLAPFILAGVGVALGMAASMILLSISVGVMVKQAEKLKDKEIRTTIGDMIGGVLGGFLDGIKTLAEGKTGLRGMKEFIKNSAALMAGVAVLMSVSISLSMFAKALTAFVNLGNMRVIKGYKENGEPIFGETVDIQGVGQTVGETISSFLTNLIESTTGLTRRQAGAIKKMGRALTGRRGILSAIIQFADVLKVFAQFGPEGKIGYAVPVLDENGNIKTDGNGDPIMRQESVPIDTVVQNIIDSFGTFVTHLTSHSSDFELTGKEGRRMKRLGKVLSGRNGLLEPISEFAETLQIYSKFGENLMIPIMDSEGKPTGKTISVEQVGANILKTLVSFVDSLSAEKLKQKTKRAEKNLKNYKDVIKLVSKTAKGLDDLTKLTDGTTKLAESIKLLSTNLAELDLSKLEGVVAASAAYVAKTEGYNNVQETTTAAPVPVATPGGLAALEAASGRPTETASRMDKKKAEREQEANWDMVAQKIGTQVGAQIMTAVKAGQLKFIFTGANEGILEVG